MPTAAQVTRVACLALPALPLQLALKRRPAWRGRPAVVIDKLGPQGVVRWANAAARRARVHPGARYAAACSLVPELRAATVSADELADAHAQLLSALQRCSPRVEPSAARPGVFWLDPGGLERLFGDLETWGRQTLEVVRELELSATIVIGFSRFASLAVAQDRSRAPRAEQDVWLLEGPAQERAALARVPLASLPREDFPPRLRETLAPLGVRTLGDFLALPAPALRLRFGRAAAELHARANGQTWDPLTPAELLDPLVLSRVVDPPDDHHERLLFILKEALAALLARLDARGESQQDALRSLTIDFEFDMAIESLDGAPGDPDRPHDPSRLEITPAAPTRDLLKLVDLIRLRLGERASRGGFPAPVRAMTLTGERERRRGAQVNLLPGQRPRRDPEAAAAALARLRAAFGDHAVTRARLRDAHLPEARFTWEQTTRLPRARPAPPPDPWPANDHDPLQGAPLLRRVFARPLPLPSPPEDHLPWRVPQRAPRERPASAAPAAGDDKSPKTYAPKMTTVRRLHGPFRVSGGWWARTVERDYYYAETAHGALMWIFYDRPRDRWFWHGLVD